MKNSHGLDTDYFRKKLQRMLRDIELYTPQEFATELEQMADTAFDRPNGDGMFPNVPDCTKYKMAT